MCSHRAKKDSTFHLKVPLRLKPGHVSQPTHGWDSSRCFLLGLAGSEEQDSAPDVAQYLPPQKRPPLDVLDAHFVCSGPAQLRPSPSTWWDQHQGDTSHSWDFLLLQSTRPYRPAHRASCHPDPEHRQGLKKRAFYKKKSTQRRPRLELWRASQGASVGLSIDDFGKASPSPALLVRPSHITCSADLGFIPRKDAHANGKQCSNTTSHPTQDLCIYNIQVDDNGGTP